MLAHYSRIALDSSELQGELPSTQDGFKHTRLHEGLGFALFLLWKWRMRMGLHLGTSYFPKPTFGT